MKSFITLNANFELQYATFGNRASGSMRLIHSAPPTPPSPCSGMLCYALLHSALPSPSGISHNEIMVKKKKLQNIAVKQKYLQFSVWLEE